ncbi:MAG TPA: hypothetical protein VFZ04_17015, partial [Longimicrobiales bacterium]
HHAGVKQRLAEQALGDFRVRVRTPDAVERAVFPQRFLVWRRIEHSDAIEANPGPVRRGAYFRRGPEYNGRRNAFVFQPARGGDDAFVVTFWKNDAPDAFACT